jgi:bifunctional non-homologous end joining protein LigD
MLGFMPKFPRPRQRKTDAVAERIAGRAIVAKASDRRQLELFDEPFQARIEPCKPTLMKTPPPGPQWLHEIRWDGFRVLAYLKDGEVRIKTSSSLNWSERFPAIAAAVADLHIRSAVLDGEAVVLDNTGHSHFGDLHVALGHHADSRDILLYTFDQLYYDGMDIRAWLLENRRAVLEGLIGDGHGTALVRSEEFDAAGAQIFDHACKLVLKASSQSGATSPINPAKSTAIGSRSNAYSRMSS